MEIVYIRIGYGIVRDSVRRFEVVRQTPTMYVFNDDRVKKKNVLDKVEGNLCQGYYILNEDTKEAIEAFEKKIALYEWYGNFVYSLKQGLPPSKIKELFELTRDFEFSTKPTK